MNHAVRGGEPGARLRPRSGEEKQVKLGNNVAHYSLAGGGAAVRDLHVGDCKSGRESGAARSPLSQQRPALQSERSTRAPFDLT